MEKQQLNKIVKTIKQIYNEVSNLDLSGEIDNYKVIGVLEDTILTLKDITFMDKKGAK